MAASIGAGAWIGARLPASSVASTGAGIGLGIGMVIVLLVLRDPGHRDGPPQAVRVRARSRR